MMRNRLVYLAMLTAAIGTLPACGGGGGGSDTATPQGGSAPSPAPTPAPAPAPAPTQAQLTWSASSSSDVVGYRVYWGTASGSYVQSRGAGVNTGAATSYTVGGLTVGQTYYFAVTAYDAAGNESAFSGEVSKAAR